MTTIQNRLVRPEDSKPVFGVVVRAYLRRGQFSGTDDEYVLSGSTQSDVNGDWSLNLDPNSEISPAGSWYEIREGVTLTTIQVPATGGPYELADVLFDPLGGVALGDGVNSVNGLTGPNVVLTKDSIGLGNVNNTSDANKPVSAATAAALAGKAPLVHTHTEADVTGLTAALAAKVDDTDIGVSVASLVGGTVPVAQLPDQAIGVTQAELDSAVATAVPLAYMGVPSGVATLNSSGVLSNAQRAPLPSFMATLDAGTTHVLNHNLGSVNVEVGVYRIDTNQKIRGGFAIAPSGDNSLTLYTGDIEADVYRVVVYSTAPSPADNEEPPPPGGGGGATDLLTAPLTRPVVGTDVGVPDSTGSLTPQGFESITDNDVILEGLEFTDGLDIYGTGVIVRYCKFSGTSDGGSGAALFVRPGGSATIHHCEFEGQGYAVGIQGTNYVAFRNYFHNLPVDCFKGGKNTWIFRNLIGNSQWPTSGEPHMDGYQAQDSIREAPSVVTGNWFDNRPTDWPVHHSSSVLFSNPNFDDVVGDLSYVIWVGNTLGGGGYPIYITDGDQGDDSLHTVIATGNRVLLDSYEYSSPVFLSLGASSPKQLAWDNFLSDGTAIATESTGRGTLQRDVDNLVWTPDGGVATTIGTFPEEFA